MKILEKKLVKQKLIKTYKNIEKAVWNDTTNDNTYIEKTLFNKRIYIYIYI